MEVAGILTIHKIVKLKAKKKDNVTDGKPDLGLLQGIADKPNLELYGQPLKYQTPIRKAACLMEGIARLHTFTDGNKRTALYTAYAFLQNAGYDLNLKIVKSSFLVYLASDKSRSEEEIDMLIDEIEFYLNKRLKKQWVSNGEILR